MLQWIPLNASFWGPGNPDPLDGATSKAVLLATLEAEMGKKTQFIWWLLTTPKNLSIVDCFDRLSQGLSHFVTSAKSETYFFGPLLIMFILFAGWSKTPKMAKKWLQTFFCSSGRSRFMSPRKNLMFVTKHESWQNVSVIANCAAWRPIWHSDEQISLHEDAKWFGQLVLWRIKGSSLQMILMIKLIGGLFPISCNAWHNVLHQNVNSLLPKQFTGAAFQHTFAKHSFRREELMLQWNTLDRETHSIVQLFLVQVIKCVPLYLKTHCAFSPVESLILVAFPA